MSDFMNDKAVVERVLSHVRDATTDEGGEIWREPVENYRSWDRFRQELALLRRLPVPFCPSAALREPGDYVARQAAGVPILAVRGKDGKVRAFPNALVTVLSHHTILVVLEPTATGRTRNVAYSLAHTGGDPVLAESAKRDAKFVTDTGAPEDRALAESVQRTMESGANQHYTFGYFESAIIHFHRNLNAALEE